MTAAFHFSHRWFPMLQETGLIQVGDLIVEVNGDNLYHRPYQDTIEAIRSSETCVFGFTRNVKH